MISKEERTKEYMADMFGIQFYPTPEWLVDKMLDKVDFSDVTSILEPSAGKGDIIQGIRRYDIRKKTYYDLHYRNSENKLRREIFLNLGELNAYFLKTFNLDVSKMTINEINYWFEDNTDEKDDYSISCHQPSKEECFKCEIEQ